MSIDYSAKDAKRLIEFHGDLLNKVQNAISAFSNSYNDTLRVINEIISADFINNIVLDNCNEFIDVIPCNAELRRLMLCLYKYQSIKPYVEEVANYENSVCLKVRQNIELLKPCIGGLSRFFSSKAVKDRAVQAYYELQSLSNDNRRQEILSACSKVDLMTYLTEDVAWNAYSIAPENFYDTLKHISPELFKTKNGNPFQSILQKYKDLDRKITECLSKVDKDKNNIKEAAEKVMSYNALQILKSVPVDEVNRDKEGFRVKALRDAGLTNMADIYAASTYQLASIYGISEDAAYSLKRIATNFLKNAHEGIKIKLSSDDRNKHSAELIKAIYAFRLKKSCRDELAALVDGKRMVLSELNSSLESVGSGFLWLFYSMSQRTDIKSAYAEISRAVNGDYASEVEKISKMFSNASRVSDETAWKDFESNNIEYTSILEEILPGALGNDDILYGLPEELAREIQEEAFFPDGLTCSLRRYQEWGVKYILHQKKVLLGDEMGLGKTVQAIATMVSLRNTGATHFLVICPASVITNWCREIAKHSKLRVTKIHGTGRNQALKSWVKTGGVAVTTFETTAYIKNDNIEAINLLVVDEAHYIKNPEARRSINVKRLCELTERILFMTGTALENKVEEMVELITLLQPNVANAIQGMTFMPSAPQFRKAVVPVYYRRKREDVLTELPDLIESKEWCSLSSIEEALYKSNVLAKNYSASRRLSWDVDDLKDSCKATRLLEILEEAKSEGRKVLVFSFFLDTIRAIGNLLGARCYGPINGSVPPQRRQEILDSFDNAPDGSVLLAQIQSGGTGLNIQSASVVVICEPQLKPSIENQAISRAYRMGQARNVLVYRLLCLNTIDEKITELLESKQAIFDAFADKSAAAELHEAQNVEVDEKSFGQIIQEEIDRINAENNNVLNTANEDC